MVRDMTHNELVTGSDIFIIELKLQGDGIPPVLYTIMHLRTEKDSFLHDEKNLLFYRDLSDTNRILEKHFITLALPDSTIHKRIQYCNPSEAVRLILEVEEVDDALLLDTINSLLDFVNTLPVAVPRKFRTILHKFADHLTFETNCESFFEDTSYQRSDLLKAIQWCTEYVTNHMNVINLD